MQLCRMQVLPLVSRKKNINIGLRKPAAASLPLKVNQVILDLYRLGEAQLLKGTPHPPLESSYHHP